MTSHLELNQMGISGTIPTSVGTLDHLESLNLSANQLSGEVPVELLELQQSVPVILWGNRPLKLPRIPTNPLRRDKLSKIVSIDVRNGEQGS